MDRHAWDERYDARETTRRFEPSVHLPPELVGLEPGTAIELACGEGRNAVWLAEQGWRVTGVDFSERGLVNARALAARRGVEVEWVACDLLEWEAPAGAGAGADLVLIFFLHLPADERREVYRRAVAAMAPGATLIVVGHDLANLTRGWGGPRDPTVALTTEAVVGDLSQFPEVVIERAERVRRPVTFIDGEGRDQHSEAVDCVVRARRVAEPRP